MEYFFLTLGPSTFPHFGNLQKLKRIWLSHSALEYQSLKALLQIAPNLSELFIGYENLVPMFDDEETCHLLAVRVVHLLLLRCLPTSSTKLCEQSIPKILSIFRRVRHLQIDVTYSTAIEPIVLAVIQSIESRPNFISLVVEGKTLSDGVRSNAKQWLIERTFLKDPSKFDAQFKAETNRFLLWM